MCWWRKGSPPPVDIKPSNCSPVTHYASWATRIFVAHTVHRHTQPFRHLRATTWKPPEAQWRERPATTRSEAHATIRILRTTESMAWGDRQNIVKAATYMYVPLPYRTRFISVFMSHRPRNTGLYKFSTKKKQTILTATSKLWAPNGWQETSSILKIHKY
jgi:hypothetical protein